MPSTITSQHSPASSPALSVDQLFGAAFNAGRAPRSDEYKAGVRMALQHRIERKDFEMPYLVGTTAADAFFAGIEEGKALWRRAQSAIEAQIGGAA